MASRAHGIGPSSALERYEGRVYHYTSAEGLLGIISSGRLRASEASSLNDVAEVEFGWQEVDDWFGAQEPTRAVEYIQQVASLSRRDPQHQVFVLSGTDAGDDTNQWRSYASGGRGYAIELDGSVSLGVVSLNPDADEEGGPAYGAITEFAKASPWYRVLYTAEDVHVKLRAVVAHVNAELAELDKIEGDEENSWRSEALAQAISDELATIAHLCKANGFSGEREVRVVVRFFWFGDHVEYRAGAYGIAGHIYLVGAGSGEDAPRRVIPAPSMDRANESGFAHPLPIKGIRLGPLVHRGNEETTGAFARKFGLRELTVQRSAATLR